MSDPTEDPPRTVRPGHPVVAALEAEDPGAAFLQLMFERLAPAEWHVVTERGFWWVPYRLSHEIDVFSITDHAGRERLIARSTFLLVDNVDDVGAAVSTCAYLGQRSFGGAVWFDEVGSTIRLTSSVWLDSADWFNAHLFVETVTRLIGTCETLAPRLASWVNGRVPDVAHPAHGVRNEPDRFVSETLLCTYVPETTTGLWWSRREIEDAARATRFLLQASGFDEAADMIDPTDYDDHLPAAHNLHVAATVAAEDRWLRFRLGAADHPDLGLGLELLVSTSVAISGGSTPPTMAERTFQAAALANELNRIQAEDCAAELLMGGWTSWEGQLFHATFIWPEVGRTLQALAAPLAGDVAGLLTRGVFDIVSPLLFLLDEHDLLGAPFEHVDELRWSGVEQNAGLHSLFIDDDAVVSAVLGDLPLNTLIEPVEITDAWALQHSQVLATMGIFNPMGPTVGSIEIAINYSLGRGLLIERSRHPSGPSIRLHAVLDQTGFVDDLEALVEQMVPALPWSLFHWFEIRTPAERTADAIYRGLHTFADTTDFDPAQEAQRTIEAELDPWRRLDTADPSGHLEDGLDGTDTWISLITMPSTININVAYLRSAWEGATQILRPGGGFDAAQQAADRCREEIHHRLAPAP